jgi:hypothetical protein
MVNDARSDDLIQKTLTKTGIGPDLLEAIQHSAERPANRSSAAVRDHRNAVRDASE